VNELRLLRIEMLHLLWLAPVLAVVFYWAAQRRRRALEGFAESALLAPISNTVSAVRRGWKALLIVVAVVLSAVALARPAWNPIPQQVERRGRDVVFLLDVSRSMLAEDLAPNRLDRAKLAMLDSVERLNGDRVALIAFAGTAVVKCPLTLDYGFFRMALEDVSPESVTRGGTLIGDAIRKALNEVFDDQQKEFKDIILITDGEDHESFPVEAAQEAGTRGVRLIAIGLGNENEGTRIPVTGPDGDRVFLKYNGEEVWSKLDADTLRKMVNTTPGGRYLNVATGAIDLGDVYVKLIANETQREFESRTIERFEEKFQIFLGVAFFLLCIEMFIRDRRPGERVTK
jgi:Ca-activated chloride channel family protein